MCVRECVCVREIEREIEIERERVRDREREGIWVKIYKSSKNFMKKKKQGE